MYLLVCAVSDMIYHKGFGLDPTYLSWDKGREAGRRARERIPEHYRDLRIDVPARTDYVYFGNERRLMTYSAYVTSPGIDAEVRASFCYGWGAMMAEAAELTSVCLSAAYLTHAWKDSGAVNLGDFDPATAAGVTGALVLGIAFLNACYSDCKPKTAARCLFSLAQSSLCWVVAGLANSAIVRCPGNDDFLNDDGCWSQGSAMDSYRVMASISGAVNLSLSTVRYARMAWLCCQKWRE